MLLSVWKETWFHLIRNNKNRLTIVLVLLATLAYSVFFLPRIDGYGTIDVDRLEDSIPANKGLMQTAVENRNFDINGFTGKSAYLDGKHKYENNSALLAAIENGDIQRYLDITNMYRPDFYYDELFETYNENSLYPDKDRFYDSINFSNRTGSYDPATITFHVLQEKTAWQQIQLFLHNWGPTILVVLTLFIAADIFVMSVHKRTQRIGVPISWGKYLFVQSVAIFGFILLFFLAMGLIFFTVNGLLYGFGSLDFQVPLFTYSEDYMMNPDVYGLMSIGTFIIQALPFLILMLYFFIRLSALLSLLFRQEVVVFVAGLFVLLFEKLYYSRTTRDIFGIDIAKFPQTYFDFGKVVSGEKSFMINTDTITAEQGFQVLLISIIALEVILAIAAYLRTRQRFIA